MHLFPCDQIGNHDTFVAGLVGQPWGTRNVPNCKQAINARAAIFVRHNMGAINGDAKRLKPQILNIADNANSGNHRVKVLGRGFAVLFDMGGHLAIATVQLFNHRFFADFHPLLFKLLFREF